jgi:hypothetical protein
VELTAHIPYAEAYAEILNLENPIGNHIWWPRQSMESTNGSQAGGKSWNAVRLPPFWADRPAVWLAQAEAQFSLAGISNERIKFHYIISQLDHRYEAEVEDIINSPLQQDPYITLKTELLNLLSPTRERITFQIITFEEMGDRKLFQFLRHLRSLAPDLPENFLRSIWCSRLPHTVQTALTGQPEIGLNAMAHCAGRIDASSNASPCRSSRVLADLSTIPSSCGALRNSLAWLRLSAPSGTTAAPAPESVALAPRTHATDRGVALPAPKIAPSTTVRPLASHLDFWTDFCW